MRLPLAFLAPLAAAAPAFADPAAIVSAEASRAADGWRFDVTIAHEETGWDDYANGWRVLGPDGAVLGTRVLAHPHPDEQPFTRSLSGVAIPDGVEEVAIQSSTLATGWSGETLALRLPD
ncbi:hypothetical protein BCF33_1581 [Hasllibacter halocynthiae]|uniref:Uncharacterized protein n=1 Tax=Hasllibacter halocynthiae TaxID=595589 RepID=A0A2T0X1D0_9RHOB|nr:hypothetical protein [Hasllibacter halocynthiae]PRY92727.1 hypothetical protein BCF33_1581 [Hasllibacter halocynthiae]